MLIHVVEFAEFAPGAKQIEDCCHNPPKVVHSSGVYNRKFVIALPSVRQPFPRGSFTGGTGGQYEPAGHVVQLFARLMLYVPAGHVIHEVEPPTLYVPAAQGLQEAAPAAVENVPPAHGEQVVAPAGLYVPAGHIVYVLTPAVQAYPAGQAICPPDPFATGLVLPVYILPAPVGEPGQ